MSYPKAVYNEALRKVNIRREINLSLFDQNINKIYQSVIGLKQIDTKISMTTIKITRDILTNEILLPINELKEENLRLQKTRNMLLENAGYSPDDLKVNFDCKLCDDTGYYQGHLCSCVKKVAREIIYNELNKDVPLENSKFENFQLEKYSSKESDDGIVPRQRAEKIFKYCKKYAANFTEKSNSILFFGSTGVGKTHLSLAIANEVINKGFNVIYGPISRLLGKVETEHFSGGQKETISAILNCDLLILDDLGTEFSSTFIISTVYDIINSRLLASRPIIINTNLNFKGIEEKYSQRTVSRIAGNYKMLEIIGLDNRLS